MVRAVPGCARRCEETRFNLRAALSLVIADNGVTAEPRIGVSEVACRAVDAQLEFATVVPHLIGRRVRWVDLVGRGPFLRLISLAPIGSARGRTHCG